VFSKSRRSRSCN